MCTPPKSQKHAVLHIKEADWLNCPPLCLEAGLEGTLREYGADRRAPGRRGCNSAVLSVSSSMFSVLCDLLLCGTSPKWTRNDPYK